MSKWVFLCGKARMLLNRGLSWRQRGRPQLGEEGSGDGDLCELEGDAAAIARDLLLKATRGVTIAVISSRERKRWQPGLATDDPAFVGWHQLVRGIQGS